MPSSRLVSTSIVVDSSAIVDALAAGENAEGLRTELATHELHAPMLVDYEVVSALRGLTRAGRLTLTRGEDLLHDFDDLIIRRWAFTDPLRRRACALRNALSSYDAAYVALAEALDCPLLTRDGRLARSSGHSAHILLR